MFQTSPTAYIKAGVIKSLHSEVTVLFATSAHV